jgi:BNR repeat protein
MSAPALARALDHVIVADRFLYSSHPHCVRLAGPELLIVFNQSVRRERVQHPPSDPLVRNYTVRSLDLGQTWLPPRVVPGYDWSGVECASLTSAGADGLLLSQWRFRWLPLDEGAGAELPAGSARPAQFSGYAGMSGPGEMPWARASDGLYVHRSEDGGRTWTDTARVDVEPYSGGYGIRSAVRLASGDLLLPLSDVPHYQAVFGVSSADGGRSWKRAAPIAQTPGRLFEEPAAAVLDDGSVLMMMRESTTDRLYQCRSDDGGASWTEPADTGIIGCPPHLLQLSDGRLLCTYGFRYFPFEIRCVLSDDGGTSWSQPVTIRTGLGILDIGYPSTVELSPGHLLTVYYGPLFDGTTGILSTSFELA